MLDSTNNDTKHLMKLLTEFNLVQFIKSPARTTATTKTIIDHIITNRSESVPIVESCPVALVIMMLSL